MYTRVMQFIREHASFAYLYAASFLFALSTYLVTYIGSNFLSESLPDKSVGLIYTLGALLGLTIFTALPRILHRFGIRVVLLSILALELCAFAALSFTDLPLSNILFFIAYLTLYPLCYYCFDLLLEHLTVGEHVTGTVRGLMLTFVNTGLIIAPMISGLLLTHNEYRNVFFVSGLLLIPVGFLIVRSTRKNPKTVSTDYQPINILDALTCVKGRMNVVRIMIVQFLLQIFFSFMVIYVPLYLKEVVGFSWPEIGLMLSVALLPYVLIEFPAGRLADRYIGEKELLVIGFCVIAGTTLTLAYTTRTDFTFWMMLLFASRIGGALIESMSDSYFFKKVSAIDTRTISFYRMIQPMAYLVGPVAGTLLLTLTNFHTLFGALAAAVAFGIPVAYSLIDTR